MIAQEVLLLSKAGGKKGKKRKPKMLEKFPHQKESRI